MKLKQFLACGFLGAIFGVIFLKFDSSLLGMVISSSMGVIAMWILYLISFIFYYVGNLVFKNLIFIFSVNFGSRHGILMLRKKNSDKKIFIVDLEHNCGIEIGKISSGDK